ncbi:PTS-dependent dihydroxyacetone kinase 2, dihydroxyacetone-binding subunit DhaK [Rhodovastum atsumiense]|uniref:Dihydroxyacetone kinase subunit DhaK n=1 Tax=Rhodovastum atsumiense TaxID=504468 RepID=A0A5M6IUI4_9PROT|nr:dihydroxyacetone kinase subunit DhaK [Rhodovastum atsumiense]KAA5611954.1 dihydroxyacetone kinase subunit DhaK [Rhodovastum atsumiense]CAH2598726.1 PTS-dependent dihydroxyacetone kinase 2, dihydroxyacetone-binding subunit DhaK [Rhodovastum atsumiense]
MKKILNNPYSYVDELLEGLVAAHPEYYRQIGAGGRVIARAGGAKPGKVGIVTGGGSGHLPVFTGYVGPGLLDACAIGDVFASPSVEQMADAIRVANGGAGVLRLYGNYGGDIMNFDMAGDMVEMEDIRTTTVLVTDDVASAPPAEASKRRGVAGMVYAFKIAGAAAEAGLDLDAVTAVAEAAAGACRTVGVALTPCVVPQAGKPTFSIGETEMEIGMGIHGEPGVRVGPLLPADAIADEMLDLLFADRKVEKGERLSVMVNSLGATPPEELYILYRRVKARIEAEGGSIVMPLVGRYATSMEMVGVSFTLCRLDPQLESYLRAPASCAFWSV